MRTLSTLLMLAGAATLASAVSPTPAQAQAGQPSKMTRATSTTGLNDSTLVVVVDSARRTRAASIAQLRKAYSVKAFDSLVTTKLTLTGATVTGQPTWSSTQAFAAGQLVDSATGAARAPAGTLTGTTLKSTVVTSSLTSLGTLAAGLEIAGGKYIHGAQGIVADSATVSVLTGTLTSVFAPANGIVLVGFRARTASVGCWAAVLTTNSIQPLPLTTGGSGCTVSGNGANIAVTQTSGGTLNLAYGWVAISP